MNTANNASSSRRHHKLLTIAPKPRHEDKKNTNEFLTNLSDIEKLRSSPDYTYLHRHSNHTKSSKTHCGMSSSELPEILLDRSRATLQVPKSFDSSSSTNELIPIQSKSARNSRNSSRKTHRLASLDNPRFLKSFDSPRNGNVLGVALNKSFDASPSKNTLHPDHSSSRREFSHLIKRDFHLPEIKIKNRMLVVA